MIPYFVITFESFDTETFVRRLREYDPEGVIVLWNYSGKIRVEQCPPWIGLKDSYRYFTPGGWTENRWIKWPTMLVIMSFLMLAVFAKTRVRRFFVTGGDVLVWVAQVFKALGRLEMTVATLDDWSLPPKSYRLGDRINHIKLFLNDRLTEIMDVKWLVLTREVMENRDRYWGRRLGDCILFEERWAAFIEKKRERSEHIGNEICLLGTARRNFGLEILFSLLPELNREYGIRLRVIGPESELYREYKARCDADGTSEFIAWRGFVESQDLPAELEKCFCGYDMQENAVNNSKFVIAGRVVHYLQNLLVPVVSEHSGAIVPFLRDRMMGVVCRPEREDIKRAITAAHRSNRTYVDAIEGFLATNPYGKSIEEWLFLDRRD